MNKIIEHFRKYCMWYILAIAVILTLNFLFLPLEKNLNSFPKNAILKPPSPELIKYYIQTGKHFNSLFDISKLLYIAIAYIFPFLFIPPFVLSFKHKKVALITLISIFLIYFIVIFLTVIFCGTYPGRPLDYDFNLVQAFYVFLTIFLLVIAYYILLLLHYIILPRYISKKSLYLRIAKLEQQVKKSATTTDEIKKDD